MTAIPFAPGNYRFVPSVFQYSAGAAADPGFHIERVMFREPVPLKAGFDLIAAMIRTAGRPLTSFCACELRSPGQFSDQGFRSFNETYVEALRAWGLFDGTTNPVARSNVCPEIAPPAEPSFHAFSFTREGDAGESNFVISGSGEAREGAGPYAERIVRYRETGADALTEKAIFVLAQMEKRMAAFGHGWKNTTATQTYSVFDIHPFMASEIARRGAARAGLTWHFARPPVVGLDYEMDCRSVAIERTA